MIINSDILSYVSNTSHTLMIVAPSTSTQLVHCKEVSIVTDFRIYVPLSPRPAMCICLQMRCNDKMDARYGAASSPYKSFSTYSLP